MESKDTAMSPEETFILSALHALYKNRCLSVIVGLRIPELLCTASEETLSIEDIAKRSGCASSNGLYPVLKLLALWGIGKEVANKHFAKNRGMELLRRDNRPSLGHFFAYLSGDETFSAMRSLPACVKRGQQPFALEHGMNHFQYMNDIENNSYDKTKICEGSSEHPIGSDERRREFADNYNKAMAYMSDLSIISPVQGVNSVFEAFPWSTSKRLLDMGGSSGHFISQILKLPDCQHMQGYVVDLSDVVDDALKNVESLGMPKHRIEVIKHDFMKPFPNDLQLQVDTVIFKNVFGMFIHHDHEVMTKMLINCRNSFPPQGGRLLIVDYALENDGNVGKNGFELAALSLHWLSVTGNYLASKSQWVKNLQEVSVKADYQFKQVYDTFPGGVTIFELSCM